MEQTLGKRIVANRKRIGLTQDQLAERLGVTAQAVSKWENDQSCPDISMLPKLAEIFGITVDALLGCQQQPLVHEAEIVDDEENEPEGIHIHWDDVKDTHGEWEFHWDSGRKNTLTLAILVLLVGALTFLSRWLHWEASFWDILWPSAMLIWGIRRLMRKGSVFSLALTIGGMYFLVFNLNGWSFGLELELVFPALLVILGISMFADALKQPKESRFRVFHNNADKSSHFSAEDGRFNCTVSFSDEAHPVALPRLEGGTVSVNFGEATIDLTGCEAVSEQCAIDAGCSFGELHFRVPKAFRVYCASNTSFANVRYKGQPDTEPAGGIHIDANVNFGQVTIEYI